MSGPIVRWLRRHDPEWTALHKAIKVAVVVTAGLAIGTLLIGNAQLSLFASFGGVAFLLFADFPGGRSARLGAYLGLAVVGAVLISLGTLASGTAWLAVAGMAGIGFLVLFGGVLSAAAAGATRAALLAFILPVTVPGTVTDIPARLGGWGIAAVLAIPAAVLVWPPRDHDKLRARASEACAALARQLTARCAPPPDAAPVQPGTSTDDHRAATVDESTEQAITALRQQFRSTSCRPVGLTTGSRLLMQLTDRLEWLRAVADRIPSGTSDRWSGRTRELVTSCAAVLRTSADVLSTASHRPTYDSRQRLATALREVEHHRAQVSVFVDLVTAGGTHSASAQKLGAPPAAVAHELAYTTYLAGHTVAVAAAADARPLIDRLVGRRAPGAVDGPLVAARRIAAGHITRRSVWFQNSVRGALGLSVAVLIAEVTEIAHGFWVVLAAMSVLRTTALTTGSTALRALSGTFIGFLIGAAIMLVVGTTPWHLWLLLPFVVVFAAYMPEAVSFVAGQAAFTVMVVILFNIIEPVGWRVGLVRIEDIALGCAAGLVSGVLLWPRGAAAQIRHALGEHYQRAAAALEAATDRLVHRPAPPTAGTLEDVISDARSASLRLDDAFREYLFERGTKSVPVEALTAVSNGGNRVRLAAEAIAGLAGQQASIPVPSGMGPGPRQPAAGSGRNAQTLPTAGDGLAESAATSAQWFHRLAGVLDHPKNQILPVPPVVAVGAEARVLATFEAMPGDLADPTIAAQAKNQWVAALYIDDVTRLQTRLTGFVTTLNERSRPGAPPDLDEPPGSPP